MNLRRNLGYKLLSLGLGILLYATAEAQRNPTIQQDMFVIPRVENLPGSFALRQQPETLSVTVSGPASAIQAFRAQSVKATVDLRTAKAGSNHLPIRYQYNPALLQIAGPPFTDVTLEKKSQRSFHVDVDYNDRPPPGLAFNDPTTNPNTVIVGGLTSDVLRVVRVAAVLDNDETAVVRRPVDLVAQNAQGEGVDGVQIVPSQVLVTLTTRKTLATKTLVLSPVLEGVPASGYILADYRFEPQSLTVSGDQASLSRLSSLSVPVQLDDLKASVVRQIAPRLPKGVSLDGGEPKTVRLRIEIRPQPTVNLPAPTPTPAPTATPTPVPNPEASSSPERN